MFDLQVVGIIVVSPAVLIRKERFAGILSPNESGLHLITIRELVFQPVAVRPAFIDLVVALPLIERDFCRRHQFVSAILRDGLQTGKALFLFTVINLSKEGK